MAFVMKDEVFASFPLFVIKLIKEDLPTFDLPATAISGISSVSIFSLSATEITNLACLISIYTP